MTFSSMQTMQIAQRLSPVVATVLLAIAAWLSAMLCWDIVLWLVEDETGAQTTQTVSIADVPKEPAYDLNLLLSVPLFGKAEITATPVNEQAVRRSNLRIKLLGVIASGESGVAILRHDGKEYAYKVGDRLEVSESITLAMVRPEYVIISRAGGDEKIELEKAGGSSELKGVRSVRSQDVTEQTVDLTQASIRRLIGDPVDTLNNNPLRLTRFIALEPYLRNGRTEGFALQPGRDKRLFGLLGLENNDVVTAVNGQRVSETAVNDLLKSVSNGQSVEVEILRKGQPQTIRLEL